MSAASTSVSLTGQMASSSGSAPAPKSQLPNIDAKHTSSFPLEPNLGTATANVSGSTTSRPSTPPTKPPATKQPASAPDHRHLASPSKKTLLCVANSSGPGGSKSPAPAGSLRISSPPGIGISKTVADKTNAADVAHIMANLAHHSPSNLAHHSPSRRDLDTNAASKITDTPGVTPANHKSPPSVRAGGSRAPTPLPQSIAPQSIVVSESASSGGTLTQRGAPLSQSLSQFGAALTESAPLSAPQLSVPSINSAGHIRMDIPATMPIMPTLTVSRKEIKAGAAAAVLAAQNAARSDTAPNVSLDVKSDVTSTVGGFTATVEGAGMVGEIRGSGLLGDMDDSDLFGGARAPRQKDVPVLPIYSKLCLQPGSNSVALGTFSHVDQLKEFQLVIADPMSSKKEAEFTLIKKSFVNGQPNETFTTLRQNFMECRTMFVLFQNTMIALEIIAPFACELIINPKARPPPETHPEAHDDHQLAQVACHQLPQVARPQVAPAQVQQSTHLVPRQEGHVEGHVVPHPEAQPYYGIAQAPQMLYHPHDGSHGMFFYQRQPDGSSILYGPPQYAGTLAPMIGHADNAPSAAAAAAVAPAAAGAGPAGQRTISAGEGGSYVYAAPYNGPSYDRLTLSASNRPSINGSSSASVLCESDACDPNGPALAKHLLVHKWGSTKLCNVCCPHLCEKFKGRNQPFEVRPLASAASATASAAAGPGGAAQGTFEQYTPLPPQMSGVWNLARLAYRQTARFRFQPSWHQMMPDLTPLRAAVFQVLLGPKRICYMHGKTEKEDSDPVSTADQAPFRFEMNLFSTEHKLTKVSGSASQPRDETLFGPHERIPLLYRAPHAEVVSAAVAAATASGHGAAATASGPRDPRPAVTDATGSRSVASQYTLSALQRPATASGPVVSGQVATGSKVPAGAIGVTAQTAPGNAITGLSGGSPAVGELPGAVIDGGVIPGAVGGSVRKIRSAAAAASKAIEKTKVKEKKIPSKKRALGRRRHRKDDDGDGDDDRDADYSDSGAEHEDDDDDDDEEEEDDDKEEEEEEDANDKKGYVKSNASTNITNLAGSFANDSKNLGKDSKSFAHVANRASVSASPNGEGKLNSSGGSFAIGSAPPAATASAQASIGSATGPVPREVIARAIAGKVAMKGGGKRRKRKSNSLLGLGDDDDDDDGLALGLGLGVTPKRRKTRSKGEKTDKQRLKDESAAEALRISTSVHHPPNLAPAPPGVLMPYPLFQGAVRWHACRIDPRLNVESIVLRAADHDLSKPPVKVDFKDEPAMMYIRKENGRKRKSTTSCVRVRHGLKPPLHDPRCTAEDKRKCDPSHFFRQSLGPTYDLMITFGPGSEILQLIGDPYHPDPAVRDENFRPDLRIYFIREQKGRELVPKYMTYNTDDTKLYRVFDFDWMNRDGYVEPHVKTPTAASSDFQRRNGL